jgi:sugar phosphate isomerase/epimerase
MNTPRPIDRRSFLRSSAAAAAPLTAPSALSAATRADPMRRIAMTTVVFRFRFPATRPDGYAGPESLLELRDVPAYFADRFRVHNLELWSLHFESTSTGYLRDLAEAVRRARSRVINLQVDQPYNLADPDETRRREGIERVKEWVGVARSLGAPSVRANIGNGEVETAIASLREINDFAATEGVRLLTENHGGISTDPDVFLAVLDAIPHPNFGGVADFGNFAPGIDRYQALQRIVPRSHLVSAKTQLFDETLRHVSFDFDRCIRISEAAGFRGIYSAEQWDPSREPRDFERIADFMIDRVKANL